MSDTDHDEAEIEGDGTETKSSPVGVVEAGVVDGGVIPPLG
jgi:hypothetical protein